MKKLGDLNIGDRFYMPPKKDIRFKVLSKAKWDSSGSPLVSCLCENDKKTYRKRKYNNVCLLPPK